MWRKAREGERESIMCICMLRKRRRMYTTMTSDSAWNLVFLLYVF
jgi:hypothetical protein